MIDSKTVMWIAIVLQAGLGLALGAGWLARRESRVLSNLVGIALLGVCMAFGGALVAKVVFHNGFAAVGLWFHAIVFVLAPLTFAAGCLGWRRREWAAGTASAVAGLAVIACGWYATRVEPFRLQVNHHGIQSDRLAPGMAAPIVVAVLADIQTDHVGAYEERIFAQLDALEPDLILLPGDYLQCASEEAFLRERRALAALFASLRHRPRLGILAVDGDVDLAEVSLAGMDVTCLQNQSVTFESDRLQVIGLTTASSRRDLSPDIQADIESFPGLTIVCGHAPDFMSMALEDRFEGEAVFVAGHTHGGQVVIPGYGPPLTLSRVPRWLAAGGRFRHGATELVVSRGLGMERSYAPRVRFLCPPEIVVLELGGPLP